MESQSATNLLIKQNVYFLATCYGLNASHHAANCRKIYTEEFENDMLFKTKVLSAQFPEHITENIMFSLILIYKILLVV